MQQQMNMAMMMVMVSVANAVATRSLPNLLGNVNPSSAENGIRHSEENTSEKERKFNITMYSRQSFKE
jgi:hypothetical protein